MESSKKIAIEELVDSMFYSFAEWFRQRHLSDVDNPNWPINKKKNNVFIAELWPEFVMYSALVRSFDSSLWNLLEKLWRSIWKLSYDVNWTIKSYLLKAQEDKIEEIVNAYSTSARNRIIPSVSHYDTYSAIIPKNIESFRREHETDHYFYNRRTKTHYIIELKAWWDLDVKKAPSEKKQLLNEYFMLKNKLIQDWKEDEDVKLYFATAYNKDWEWHYRDQASVRSCFADNELLIWKDYRNFICDDVDWFDIIINQYKKSAKYIKEALQEIIKQYS